MGFKGYEKLVSLSRPSSPTLPSSSHSPSNGAAASSKHGKVVQQLRAEYLALYRRPSLAALIRSRLLLCTLGLLAVLSYLLLSHPLRLLRHPLSSSSPSANQQQSAQAEAYSLLSSGPVRPTLLQELSRADFGSLLLVRPAPVAWLADPSPGTPVPWFPEDLMQVSERNVSSLGSAYGEQRRQAPSQGTVRVLRTVQVEVDDEHRPPRGVEREEYDLLRASSSASSSSRRTATKAEDLPAAIHTLPTLPRVAHLPPNAPKASQLAFGLVTTPERARVMSALWTSWLLPPSSSSSPHQEEAPLCLVLFERSVNSTEIQVTQQVFKERGLDCEIRRSPWERYEIRVLSLVRELGDYAAARGRQVDWFVLGDDDTFWLDPLPLLRTLAAYPPSEPWFLGAPTEGRFQMSRHGRMAYGGAGMLISRSLYGSMYGLFDRCVEEFGASFGGDEMVTRCAALAKGRTKQSVTTELKGLHQLDIPGDASGVLQGGLPMLNLHHWAGAGWGYLEGWWWHRTPMDQVLLIQQVATFLGGDNMFRRYVFGGGKWLVSMGYSVQLYEEPLDKEELGLIEHTWDPHHLTTFSTRPLVPERHHPSLPAKQTFFIDDFEVLIPGKAAMMTFRASSAIEDWGVVRRAEERASVRVLWAEECDESLQQDDEGEVCVIKVAAGAEGEKRSVP